MPSSLSLSPPDPTGVLSLLLGGGNATVVALALRWYECCAALRCVAPRSGDFCSCQVKAPRPAGVASASAAPFRSLRCHWAWVKGVAGQSVERRGGAFGRHVRVSLFSGKKKNVRIPQMDDIIEEIEAQGGDSRFRAPLSF